MDNATRLFMFSCRRLTKGRLVFAGAFLVAGAVRGEELSAGTDAAAAGGLTWSAPTCPPRWKLEARVTRLLGEPLENFWAPPIDVRVSVLPDGQFDLVLALEGEEGPKERHLTGPDCDPLVDAAALAIALIINPGLELPDEESVAAGAAGGEPDTASEEEGEGDESDEDRGTAEPSDSLAPDPRPAPPQRDRVQLSISAGPVLDFASLGGVTAGVAGEAGVHWAQRWSFHAGGLFLPSHKVEAESVSGRFLLASGALRLCWSVLPGGTYLALCAGGQLGAVRGRAEGGQPDPGWGEWLTPTLGGELGLSLGRWGFLSRAEALFPLSRDRYEATGVEVHRIPAISAQLTLGARYKF